MIPDPVQECRSSRRALPGNSVLALHQAAVERFRGHVRETYVVRQRSEERDAGAEEDGDARDDQPLDQARFEEALDGDAAVDVDVIDAALFQRGDDVARIAGEEVAV